MLAHPPPWSSSATALHGISLIELLVGIAIIAIAVTLGTPTFTAWLYNVRIRSTAESVQNGLQFARAEAVRRNTVVRMQFTTSLDDACEISRMGTHWVVSIGSPASDCAQNPSVLQVGQPVSERANAMIDSEHEGVFGFNGWGRMATTMSPGTKVENAAIDIKPRKGACAIEAGGTLRCLRILVSAGGQIRMCDPMRDSADPMACTP